MRRVLVTRPEPGASATAAALRAAGCEPVVLPLTGISPLDPALPGALAFDAVAITSANAVRHAPPALLGVLSTLPAYAVGEATARAALQAGLTRTTTGSGDAAALAARVVDELPTGATVLYLCGRVRRPEFEQTLAAAGSRVVPVETYDTVAAEVDAAIIAAPIDAVMVHSAESARALAGLAARADLSHLFATATLVAISARAAAPVEALFGERVRIAREPTDAAMVEALRG